MNLWEHDHPYYCEENGYYYNSHQVSGWGAPLEFKTFTEFLEDFGEADPDMNFLFRWDWKRLTPTEHESEYGEKIEDQSSNSQGNQSELKLFFMMQRKGCKKVITITHMEDSDNASVHEYLCKRWERMVAVWAGVSQ